MKKLKFFLFALVVLLSTVSCATSNVPIVVYEEVKEHPLTFEWQNYIVKRGDSISSIAKTYGVSLEVLIIINDIKNARELREGDSLRIPNIDGFMYKVKAKDTIAKISNFYHVPEEYIMQANDISSGYDIQLIEGQYLFIPGIKRTYK